MQDFDDDDVSASSGSQQCADDGLADDSEDVYGDFEDVEQQEDAAASVPVPDAPATAMPDASSELCSDSALLNLQVGGTRRPQPC